MTLRRVPKIPETPNICEVHVPQNLMLDKVQNHQALACAGMFTARAGRAFIFYILRVREGTAACKAHATLELS